MRDSSDSADQRVSFTPKILPSYLRKSKSLEEFIPWLYLKGISTNDFNEVLGKLFGREVDGFSANVVTRLKERWSQEYDQWNRRSLTDKKYVYIWADGIHSNVRPESPENKKQCLLVLIGASRAAGHPCSRLGLELMLKVVSKYRLVDAKVGRQSHDDLTAKRLLAAENFRNCGLGDFRVAV
ncbi:MAG: transposase [Planctomycetales bacterium]|nr:transposase [Planctomycetales bacterium]